MPPAPPKHTPYPCEACYAALVEATRVWAEADRAHRREVA